ncbi:MAG: prepilin-type N-terminal cleavage/methylation domain-containing protein [Planctomycetes bacterium]|nr:prepilin-type N-terminal cleavage/methylation domain-containing protein [Planctomycetota bacterium]
MNLSSRPASPRGFTLVELIVVLVIIAAVSGLVIPAVASLGRSTDMAASAKTQQDLANNLQQFFVLQKRFPQGMDSLLQVGTAGAATGAPTGVYAPVLDTAGQQISGMTTSSPNLYSALVFDNTNIVDATGSEFRRSLTRGGFDYVHDHQSYDITALPAVGQPNANNSGSIRRVWAAGAIPVARLNGTVAGDPALTASDLTLLRRLVPAEFDATGAYTPEIGTHLIAMGIGPNCRLVPTTMMNCPSYPGADGKYYGRYVAIFKIYATGERPTLIAVVDAYGRTSDYTIQQFNESLPNGARQG